MGAENSHGKIKGQGGRGAHAGPCWQPLSALWALCRAVGSGLLGLGPAGLDVVLVLVCLGLGAGKLAKRTLDGDSTGLWLWVLCSLLSDSLGSG
jgi:hypothetical protein